MPISTAPIVELLPAGQWHVDTSRSRVEFTVRKLGAGTVRGHFADAAGGILIDAGQASAAGSVRVASVATGNEDRDAHLCAAGFFAAETYPEITFVSDEIAPIDRRRFRIRGHLTIRDQRREVELIATRDGAHRLEVRGEIDRRDFGLVWNRAIEVTGAVSTTIRIALDLQLDRAPGTSGADR